MRHLATPSRPAQAPDTEPRGFVVRLPEPPGANDLHMPVIRYRKGGKAYVRMIRTPEYDAWIIEAGHKLNRQETEQIKGRFSIDITVVGDSGCDTDSVLKATVDLLVKHKLLVDDARKFQRHCAVDVWPELPGVGGYPIPKGEMAVRVRGLPGAEE